MSLQKRNTLLLTLFLIIATPWTAHAQTSLGKAEIDLVVDSISTLVKKYYVSLEVGEQMSNLILSNNKKGIYDKISEAEGLASRLTNDLRSFNGDLHMSVNLASPNVSPQTKETYKRVDRKSVWSNYGFQEVKVLEGNIGYLKINHFTNWNHFEEAKKVIDASFAYLQNTDALILDVRNNGGGFEEIVAYLISYLFEGEPIHLSDYYYRYQDSRHGIYTKKDLPGKRLPNIPVYVLVNSRSASAAESLAYMLKHLKRATVIGEITMGAGNGAMTHKINDRFSVTIASETTINAVTKTSFEQVGVLPNVKVSSEEAFDTGYRLALNYLKEHNSRNIAPSNYESVIEFLPDSKSQATIDSSTYKKYTGTYKNGPIEIRVSMNDSNLYAEVVGRGGKLKLIPKGDHSFLVDNLKERIQFVLDENNEIVKLIGIDSPMDLNKIK